jgi:hypothetical protein
VYFSIMPVSFCLTQALLQGYEYANGGHHDSQELLNWCLQKLSEANNRVKPTPPASFPQSLPSQASKVASPPASLAASEVPSTEPPSEGRASRATGEGASPLSQAPTEASARGQGRESRAAGSEGISPRSQAQTEASVKTQGRVSRAAAGDGASPQSQVQAEASAKGQGRASRAGAADFVSPRSQAQAEASAKWQEGLAREASAVLDTFQGQLQSCVVCSVCGTMSFMYEAFTSLQVAPHKDGVLLFSLSCHALHCRMRCPFCKRTVPLHGC